MDLWQLTLNYKIRAYVTNGMTPDLDLWDEVEVIVFESTKPRQPIPQACQKFEVNQFLGFSKAELRLECR